jgi:hypothetical protein
VLTIKETDEMKQKIKEGHKVSWFISAWSFMEIRDFFFHFSDQLLRWFVYYIFFHWKLICWSNKLGVDMTNYEFC